MVNLLALAEARPRSEQLKAVAREDGARLGLGAADVRRADVGDERLEDTGGRADCQHAAGLW